MPFTAPVLDIGSGLAQGIMAGANSLDKAVQFVGEQYVNAKAAEGTAQYLASTGAMSKDELNEFMGKSVGAKQQILGMKMAQFMQGMQLQNQKALQNNESENVINQQVNQGQVQVQTNKADLENQMLFFKKYGYLPGKSADQMPAPPQPAPGTTPTGPGIPKPGQDDGAIPYGGLKGNTAAPSVPLTPNLPMKVIPGIGPVHMVPDPNDPTKYRGYMDPKTGQFVEVK